MMKVKVQFGNDIRRWRYPDSKRYQGLLAFIKQTFGFVDEKQFYVQFEDDEGDRLTLTSENDFEDAFSSAEQEGRKSLKIFIIKGLIEDSHNNNNNNNNDVLHSFSIASPVSTSSRISSQLSQEPEKPKVNEKVQNNSPKKPEIEVKIENENENEKEEKFEESSQQNNSGVSWRQIALDFLQNKEIQTLLPQLVRRFISELRKEQQQPIANQKNLLAIIHEILGEDQFKPVVKHALYSQKIVFMLPHIVEKLQLYQGLLLTFNEDAIASWVPRLIDTFINSFSHFENINIELDVDPMCNPFFSFPFGDCNQQNDYCNSDKDKVHSGVTCDSCKCSPITGIRYKCSICSNYDLCSNCEASGKHDINHPLLKIVSPVRSCSNQDYVGLHEFLKWSSQHGRYHHGHHGHHSRGQNFWSQYCRRRYCNDQKSGDDYLSSCPRGKYNANNKNDNNKISAQFIEVVNIPDKSYCPVDTVLTKTWKVRNNGDIEWGNDVELVFLKGNECLVLEKRYQVPNAKPGEQVDISAIIKTPSKSGRYCTYFRLKKNDVFFGPSLWVELFAVPENDQALQSSAQSKVICVCVCGEKLISVNPQETYNGAQVFCDVCNRRCSSDPIVYHCPQNRNTSHPEGYDMCKKCVDDQNLMIHESNQNNSNNSQKVFVDIQLDIPNVQQNGNNNNNNNVSNVNNNDINNINNVSNVSNNNANNINNNVDNVNVNNNENDDQNIVNDKKNEDQIKFDDFDPIPLNFANDENRSEILSSNNSEPEIIEMKDFVVDNQNVANVNVNENENENENHQNQQNEEDNFEFKKELDSLLEMGFYDVETNKRLLVQRKGDIQNVIQELLQA